MAHELRFSVLVLPNVAWPEFLRRCRHVEDLGFDALGFADHLVDWAGGKGPWFELWSQLSAIAMATSRIRLTTLVAQIPLRNPALLQSPRPPLLIAAMGPVMLGLAARHADIWNSLSFAKTFDAQIEETRQRVAAIDARCAAIGRDPTTLRRSYLMFDPGARASGGVLGYYESEEIFTRMARQVIALGITDVGLYYPMLDRQAPMFERIARDVLPALKTAHAQKIAHPGKSARDNAQ